MKNATTSFKPKSNNLSKSIVIIKDINDLPKDLFVVIISTNSDKRFSIIDSLKSKNIQYVIFEKVLFQRKEDYLYVEKQLIKNKINAFVNCWPRYTKYFQKIKKDLSNKDILKFEVSGKDWSIGSNMIHMLDYLSFLIDSTDLNFTDITFTKIFTNKRTSDGVERKGFYDFIGSVTGSIGGISFSFLSLDEVDTPVKIRIKTIDRLIIINLKTKIVERIFTDIPNVTNATQIRIPYQSERTHKIIEDLYYNSKCDLTPYNDSKNLHLKILESFFQTFKKTDLIYQNRCLIT